MGLEPRFSTQGLGYVVAVEGLDGLDLADAADKIKTLASRAINATARRYRTDASRKIREQIAFPARYLDSKADGRLRVRQQASAARLEAAIEGRFDPTSLARFAKGAKTHGRKAPRLEVGSGSTTQIGRSFLMKLRNDNIGLAIRLKPGETIQNKKKMASFSRKDKNLYLLYGPSVNQVFRQVADDVAPDAAEWLEGEFLRLTEALL